MPRSARIDLPGLLQHIIVRGIERRDIFLDDQDRLRFLTRFSTLLTETATRCFAWALMTNHFHLFLMPTRQPLSLLMRRLLTSYAVFFNRRHARAGHLFQNRYKSIVCEEEPYLLELVRYIHLNPLRAGLVADLAALDRYPWSGHAVLMGHQTMESQETTEVLARFGRAPARARQQYRRFVGDGIPAGRRDELVGGGLRRSQGAEQAEIESFDERILGGGAFVDSLRQEGLIRDRLHDKIPLGVLISRVCEELGLDAEAVRRPNKTKRPAMARGIISYLAIRELGYKGGEVGRELHLGPAGVSLAVRRGETVVRENPALLDCMAPEK